MTNDDVLLAELGALDCLLRSYGYMLAIPLTNPEVQVVALKNHQIIMCYDLASFPDSWRLFADQAIRLASERPLKGHDHDG